MSPRTRTTFIKRQKEQARQEKQRAKAQRKLQRKLDNQSGAERANPEHDSLQDTEQAQAEDTEQAHQALE